MKTLTRSRLSRMTITLFFALFVLAGLSACGGDDDADAAQHEQHDDTLLVSANGHFQAELHAMPEAPVTGINMVHLKLLDAQNTPVSGATIEVEPFMPAHGHGTPEAPTVAEDGEGMYTISNIKYTMPGAWELRIDVSAGGTQDRIIADYEVK
ncbi:FixH family protein [Bradymonas sediminis]|uniref:Uncharacterized protein n=1 Tax=Bradymonas sediminis TaxID=1548548 RepID=A0A2Z4FL45_9DELT|nr:FixH family protein [Bradymonas sediminis]AWV89428.1 hypothetical protein DN745_08785 [Bradymonas sediminis]TDP73610.1 YtkA-like protein [Bradymonas sediminis]